MRYPYGGNPEQVRQNFKFRAGGQVGTLLYDIDSDSSIPSLMNIEELFAQMSKDEVLIVLGSDASTQDNQQLAFVVFSPEGWSSLMSDKKWLLIEVLKRVLWKSVGHLVNQR
jgi:hypothetical protein